MLLVVRLLFTCLANELIDIVTSRNSLPVPDEYQLLLELCSTLYGLLTSELYRGRFTKYVLYFTFHYTACNNYNDAKVSSVKIAICFLCVTIVRVW
jgi:hypothetical protein